MAFRDPRRLPVLLPLFFIFISFFFAIFFGHLVLSAQPPCACHRDAQWRRVCAVLHCTPSRYPLGAPHLRGESARSQHAVQQPNLGDRLINTFNSTPNRTLILPRFHACGHEKALLRCSLSQERKYPRRCYSPRQARAFLDWLLLQVVICMRRIMWLRRRR